MEEKCPITVSVLDKPFYQLHKAGIPLSLFTHMGTKGTMLWESRMAMQSKSGFSISFLGDQCEARTKTVHPITLKKKKCKKKATKYPH